MVSDWPVPPSADEISLVFVTKAIFRSPQREFGVLDGIDVVGRDEEHIVLRRAPAQSK